MRTAYRSRVRVCSVRAATTHLRARTPESIGGSCGCMPGCACGVASRTCGRLRMACACRFVVKIAHGRLSELPAILLERDSTHATRCVCVFRVFVCLDSCASRSVRSRPGARSVPWPEPQPDTDAARSGCSVSTTVSPVQFSNLLGLGDFCALYDERWRVAWRGADRSESARVRRRSGVPGRWPCGEPRAPRQPP